MPRVAIKRKEYKLSDFSKWLVGEMKEKKLKQSDIGKLLGISQPAVSQRLESGNFTYDQLLILFDKLQTPEKDIIRLMKM